METLFIFEDVTSAPERYKDETIRYGDPFVLESCASSEPAFLAIVRQGAGKRSPLLLRTDAASAGRYPTSDYIWTFAPAAGTKKKRGDAVSFADHVRIQIFDYAGHCRFLVAKRSDPGSVLAEKAPSSQGASTWAIASTARLRTDSSGRALPDGELKPGVEFGNGNYVALINAARYLSVIADPHGGLDADMGTLPDLPASGKAVWWRVRRSLPNATPSR